MVPTMRQQAKKQALASTSDSTDAPGPSTHDNTDRAQVTPPPQNVVGGVGLTVQDTPITNKLAGSNVYTSMHLMRDAKMQKLGLEMEGKLLGPMPVDLFLAEFLPCTGTTTVSENQQTSLQQASEQKSEIPMYQPLIAAIAPACTTLTIVDTHGHIDTDTGGGLFGGGLKPDFAAYNSENPPSRLTDFSKIEVHIEVKYSDGDDPFQDDAVPFERATQTGKDTLGQIASYATAQFATQFRTHIFSVLIFRTDARLIRWDRSGAIVTRRFNYCNTIHLLDFFLRYNNSSHEQRGVDTSVAMVLPGEGPLAARTALSVNLETPLLQFSIHDNDTAADRFYIGRKPTFDGSTSPTGRQTRAFLVFDTQSHRTLFLKDTWRIDLPRLTKEGDIYESLAAARVPHIPPCVLAADIQDHRTRTPDFVDAEWIQGQRPTLRPHRHYRIVLGVVGRRLTDFLSSRELVTALRDAAEAHKVAFESAGILHRDISVGNILITNEGRGLLIDWELSKHKGDTEKEARQHEPTGTWQFISMKLLSENVSHTLADDLESFLHVLTWVALRYMPHGLRMEKLQQCLQHVFNDGYMCDGVTVGSDHKRLYVRSSAMLDANFKNPFIMKLLGDLVKIFRYRYRTIAETDNFTPELFEKLIKENEAKLNSDWMLETFQEVLDLPGWPEHDRSFRNPLPKDDTAGLKRKSSNTFYDSQPPNKMQKPTTR